MSANECGEPGWSGSTLREIVRDVIAEVAPDEVALLDQLCQFDDEHVIRLLSRRRKRSDLLGFGLDEVVVLATPVVWVAVNQAIEQLTDSVVSSGGKALRSWLRKFFRKQAAVSVLPRLTRQQIIEVQQHVLDYALRNGMNKDQARALSDCVAGRLLRGTPVDRKGVSHPANTAEDRSPPGADGHTETAN